MTEKDRIIRQVYYDADTGFGSIKSTYDDAHKIMNSNPIPGASNDLETYLDAKSN